MTELTALRRIEVNWWLYYFKGTGFCQEINQPNLNWTETTPIPQEYATFRHLISPTISQQQLRSLCEAAPWPFQWLWLFYTLALGPHKRVNSQSPSLPARLLPHALQLNQTLLLDSLLLRSAFTCYLLHFLKFRARAREGVPPIQSLSRYHVFNRIHKLIHL